jgi:hypothetical protein
MEKVRLNLRSEREDDSMFKGRDGKTSSVCKVGPTKEDNRTCRCTAEKSCGDKPFTASTVRKKASLLPGVTAPGTGEEDRVEVAEAVRCLLDMATLTSFMSIRHEPIASAV